MNNMLFKVIRPEFESRQFHQNLYSMQVNLNLLAFIFYSYFTYCKYPLYYNIRIKNNIGKTIYGKNY